MQKQYLPVRGRKLPRFMGGSKRPRMEICEILGLPIPMVPRLHQSNGYIRRKLRVWRAQKCIPLVGAETVLISAGSQTTPFDGRQYRVGNENMQNFGRTYWHDTAFPQEECSHQKEATGTDDPKMYCSSLWKNSTFLCGSANYPVSWAVVQSREWKYSKIRGYQYPNGTVFAPKQWLYQKEATGMESSKMYCPSQCRNSTYQCGATNYSVSWGAV